MLEEKLHRLILADLNVPVEIFNWKHQADDSVKNWWILEQVNDLSIFIFGLVNGQYVDNVHLELVVLSINCMLWWGVEMEL